VIGRAVAVGVICGTCARAVISTIGIVTELQIEPTIRCRRARRDLGHVWGGVIGAIIITLVAEWTRSYYQYEFIIFGLIVLLTMMYMPRGIGGYIDRRLATRRFVALRTGKAAAKAV